MTNETNTAQIIDGGRLGCLDCGEPYGSPRFPDFVIDNAAWKTIAPNHDEGGLLCPNCICARLELAGLSNVAGFFTTGPLVVTPTPAPAPVILREAVRVCRFYHCEKLADQLEEDVVPSFASLQAAETALADGRAEIELAKTIHDEWRQLKRAAPNDFCKLLIEIDNKRIAAESALAAVKADNAALHDAVLGTICDPSAQSLSQHAMGCLQAVRDLGKAEKQSQYALVTHEGLAKCEAEIRRLADALAAETERREALEAACNSRAG